MSGFWQITKPFDVMRKSNKRKRKLNFFFSGNLVLQFCDNPETRETFRDTRG